MSALPMNRRLTGSDYLSMFGRSLDDAMAQGNQAQDQEHMMKVFAANPAYAQMLYGAQNDQRTLSLQEEEVMRKRRQQEALKQLAGRLGGTNLRDPAQRQSALAEYGAISGDVEPMFGIGGGNVPAPIQIANEIAARRAAGDEAGAILLEQAAKLGEKGTYTDPQTGEIKVLPGYAPAVGTIAGAKQDATNVSDLKYDPLTAGASERAKLEQQALIEPGIAEDKAAAGEIGKERGVAQAKLESMKASLPALQAVAKKLSSLGKVATYTAAGRGVDAVTRELNLPMSVGATARAEYMATVDNEVLPLLRQTFGAAFTVQEGEKLRATLGNDNYSPEEKDAQLKAFVEAKQREIESLERRGGTPSKTVKRFNPATGMIE